MNYEIPIQSVDLPSTVFPKGWNTLILALPLAAILLTLFDLRFGWKLDDNKFCRPVLDIFFFSSLHAICGFGLLRLPEVRHMIFERTQGKPSKFWLELFLVFFLSAAFIAVFLKVIPVGVWALAFVGIVYQIIPEHHMASQIYGISMIYNSKLRNTHNLSPYQERFLRTNEKREKLIFSWLLIFYLSFIGIQFISVQNQNIEEHWVALRYLNGSLMVLVPLMGLAWLWNAHLFRLEFNDTQKFSYLLRLILIILMPFSLFFGMFGVSFSAIHGVDYMGVLGTAISRSQQNEDQKRRLKWVLFIICSLALVLLLLTRHYVVSAELLMKMGVALPPGFQLGILFFGAIQFTHYYLDRWLYRMRDPVVREKIAPLLA